MAEVTTSALNGATSAADPGRYPATPGEFAARWNSWDEAKRAKWLIGIVNAQDRAVTCWEQDHAGQIEELHRQLTKRR